MRSNGNTSKIDVSIILLVSYAFAKTVTTSTFKHFQPKNEVSQDTRHVYFSNRLLKHDTLRLKLLTLIKHLDTLQEGAYTICYDVHHQL